MAGHSKWANIKHRKGAVDAKKGVVYAQLSKEISVAARLGGTDEAFNFRLRNAIDRARVSGMPGDNIKRAIERYSKTNSSNFEEIIYEGYGPSGIAILVEAATDNRNRTASELRLIFGKFGGNLGEAGCVSWGFKHCGTIWILKEQTKKQLTEDDLLETIDLLKIEEFDLDADQENWILITKFTDFEETLAKLQTNLQCSGEAVYLPLNGLEVNDFEISEALEKLLDKLNDNEDVQNCYHNAELKTQ
jgi:YebC/PmpR family DNA-binding regulatory protein